MKLTLLGGGGFRVPLMVRTLLKDSSEQRVRALTLWDSNHERLRTMESIVRAMVESVPHAPNVRVATDLRDAVRGADFVFSAIRVGGTDGRAEDERIAHACGVLGQETTGFGGLSYALRGIPVARTIAEAIRDEAPNAYLINFTNPAGIITEVSSEILGDRVIGICDSPVGLARHALTALEEAGEVERGMSARIFETGGPVHIDYLGLNHLGWVHRILVDGRDVLPTVLERAELIESFEEGKLFGSSWVQHIGALPNEYLHYYYYAREARLADDRAEATRGIFLASQQAEFYREAATLDGHAAFEAWNRTREEREETYMATNREAAGGIEREAADIESGGYDRVALAVMKALAFDATTELIVNTPNRGRIPSLPDDAVVEAPCRIDANGATPLDVTPLSGHELALVTEVKNAERTVIAASREGSAALAVEAFFAHPLVDGVGVARELFAKAKESFPEDLAYLR
ncbi:6-phospho-beta-glucosidase [Dermabacter sp. p3-SID358]|uniref:family 4 glycosyl hydrolase n=1 Tax=Dermabacter sp. p3-SID358 TaxID=2916114 RepID=UPI0021A2FA7B|nr:6-phospho-beta-glucosidase [Dermabacter sp. p3-SID358]MCT1867309.1 6-phospho-beta-glucosidase [Dermabacter sp. p3-SID358]